MTDYHATITAKYVNQPKNESAFSGSIKDERGDYYSVRREHLPCFRENGRYEVVYYETQSADGRTWKNIKGVNGVDLPKGVTPDIPQDEPDPGSVGQDAGQIASRLPAKDTVPDLAEQFVKSIVPAAITAGWVRGWVELPNAIRKAKHAWHEGTKKLYEDRTSSAESDQDEPPPPWD